jgi:hypothetical protein
MGFVDIRVLVGVTLGATQLLLIAEIGKSFKLREFKLGKRRLNFANFITNERLNFPAVNRYRLDIMTLGHFMTGKLSAH